MLREKLKKLFTAHKLLIFALLMFLSITCILKKKPLQLLSFFPIQNPDKYLILENTQGLFTNEFGREVSFTIRLSLEPDAEVKIGPIVSLNENEGKVVSGQYIFFTPSNYNQPQTVTVKGVDDGIADGNQAYFISLGKIQTSDYSYSLIIPPNVQVINTDKDTASIAATPTMGLYTNESGTTTSFYVVLSTQPGADVVIPSFNSNSSECSLQTNSITFTSQNWSTPQEVIVKGVDDSIIDGPATCLITSGSSTSADQVYVGKTIPVVTVINVDNDVAGFTFIPNTPAVTTESGGQASFTITMNTIPYGVVSISGITSADPTEGLVSPTNVNFNNSNWNTGHIITVTGVDDYMQDGDINYTLVFPNSTASHPQDVDYNNLPVGSPGSFTNQDDDIRGFEIVPVAPATLSPLTVLEGGPSRAFQVRLTSQPCSNPGDPVNCSPDSVTITLTNNDPSQYTISPSSLTFTPANWNVFQTVTVTAVDDYIDDGDLNLTLVLDPIVSTNDYNGLNPNDISLLVQNDDTAGFIVNPAGGVTVNENDPGGVGLEATITVVLNSQPTAPVTIGPIQSSDTLEITIAPTNIGNNTPITNRTLVFTPTTSQPITNTDTDLDGHPETSTGGWNVPQTIRVRAVIDGTLDGTQVREVKFMGRSTTDPKYSNPVLTPLNNVPATNEDSGAPKILIQAISATSFPENNTSTITFQIVLATLPTGTVTISNIVTSDTTEGVVLPNGGGSPITNRTLVFTPTTNLAPTGTNTTTGGWNMPQTVTIRSVDDGFDDGNITFKVIIPTATGAWEYAGQFPEGTNPAYNNTTGELTLTNIDNDTRGVVYSPASITNPATPFTVTEGGAPQSFTVALSSDPCTTPSLPQNCTSGAITINLTNNNPSQYTITPSSLTFSAGTWNIPQSITVNAVNDNYDESNMNFQLVVESITGSGTDYDGFNPADIAIRVNDNDTRNFNLTLSTGYNHVTSNAGGYTVYNLSLASSPHPSHTVTVTASVPTTPPQEAKILAADNVTQLDSRVFTFDSTNWNIPQTFRVMGITGSGSGFTTFNLTLTGSESTTPPPGYNPGEYIHYNGLTLNQAITNYHIGVGKKIRLAAPPASHTLTEASPTLTYFYVLLNQAPTDNVNLSFDIDTATGCTLVFSDSTPSSKQFNVSTPFLTITPTNWNQVINTNRVGIISVNDLVDDGDATCHLRITSVTSSDPYYNGIPASEKEEPLITVIDNDTRGIVVNNPTPVFSGRLITSNSGASGTVQYKLNSQPLSDVTLTFSDSLGQATYPPSITFTPSNYNTWQTITVTGNVTASTTDVNYTIVASASSGEPILGFPNGATYNSISQNQNAVNRYLLYDLVPCSSPAPASCSAALPGGGVVPATYTTTELGGKAYFGVRLRARPLTPVSISLASSNTAEGTISTSSLTFNTGNWNNYQVVTITGEDDLLIDGNINYFINFGSMSGDPAFTQTIPPLSVTNMDND